ncbi:MAG: hypothetical protein HC918_00950 [Oscillatoriales cyanobacterium SM2_1_8]|nr:hypothetical protein [Oscillatoriales cyanobacterium SM2_1_8]
MWAGIDPLTRPLLGCDLPWRPVLSPEQLAYGCHQGQMPGVIAEVAAPLQRLCPEVCRRVAIEGGWLNLYLSDPWAIAAWRQLPTALPPERLATEPLSLPAYAHARNCAWLRLAGPPPQTYALGPVRSLVGALLAAAYRPLPIFGTQLARHCLEARIAHPGTEVLDGVAPACWGLQRVFGPLPTYL